MNAVYIIVIFMIVIAGVFIIILEGLAGKLDRIREEVSNTADEARRILAEIERIEGVRRQGAEGRYQDSYGTE